MKIILVFVFLVSIACLAAEETRFQASVAYDFAGTYNLDGPGWDEDTDSKYTFSGSFEVLFALNEGILIGPGAEYQLPRKWDGELDASYGFVPLYAVCHWGIYEGDVLRPEIIANVGYNFHTGNDEYKPYGGGDLSGGLYWAVGFGVLHGGNTSLELLYRVHKGGEEWLVTDEEHPLGEMETFDVTQSNLTLRLGWRF